MARYLVEVPHTSEECVRELDSVLGYSHELLNRFDWGCKDNAHIGWALVEAQDTATVRMMLPMSLRGKAKVFGVVKFTPDDVRAFHEKAASG
jgi:hypothetical protein